MQSRLLPRGRLHVFFGTSTADNGTFFNNPVDPGFGFYGGSTSFEEMSTAGNATLVANGETRSDGDPGSIYFHG